MESGTGERLCPSTKPQEVNGILDRRVTKVVVFRICPKKTSPRKVGKNIRLFFLGLKAVLLGP